MEGAGDGFERVRAARKEDGAAKDGRNMGTLEGGLRGLRAAREEDGAAKDGRDGDTGRRVEGGEGVEGWKKMAI